jgi:hypothetical protein
VTQVTQLTTNHNDQTRNKRINRGLNSKHRARNEEQLKHIMGREQYPHRREDMGRNKTEIPK